MDEKIKNKIKEKFANLPQSIQVIILSDSYQRILIEIGKQNNLSRKQLGTLEMEVTMALMGLTNYKILGEELARELGIKKEQANNIDDIVKKTVFSSVLDLLDIMNNHSETETRATQTGEQNVGPLDKRFAGLPEDIKKIIISTGYHANLYTVADGNHLDVAQMGTLEEVTTDIVVGKLHPEDFEKILRKKIGLPEGIIEKIIAEINEKVLKPIREKMEGVYNKPRSNAYEIKPEQKPEETKNPTSQPVKIIRADLSTPELPEGHQEEHPLVLEKLGGTFRAEKVETNHSINKVDPYREMPEQ